MNLKIIAFSNFYYREIALNWVRHLAKLGLENYEIICTDEPCLEYLQEHGVKTRLHKKVDLPKDLARKYKSRGRHCLETVKRILRPFPLGSRIIEWCEHREMKRRGERFKLIWKLEIVRDVLQTGADVVMSDTDALWLKDPLHDLVISQSSDIVASTVHLKDAFPRRFREKYGYTICTGWLACKSNPQVIRYFDLLLAKAEKQKKSDDQKAFNRFLMSRRPTLKTSGLGDVFTTDGIEILALNGNLVKRGDGVPEMYVWHPRSITLAPEAKKRSFGKRWLL